MTDKELMQQALEALETGGWNKTTASITALRERLAQPQMQPCAGRNCGSTNPNLHSAECFEDYEKTTGMAQPEQEPVAWGVIASNTGKMCQVELDFAEVEEISPKWVVPLYTTPPQRKPLTHEQRFDLLTSFEPHKNKWEAPAILIDMVEAAHGIKGDA